MDCRIYSTIYYRRLGRKYQRKGDECECNGTLSSSSDMERIYDLYTQRQRTPFMETSGVTQNWENVENIVTSRTDEL